MSDEITVAVLGGGNGAFATAASLKTQGFSVRMLEVPDLARETIGPVQERGGIDLLSVDIPGLTAGFASLDIVTDNPEVAMRDADIILYVVPAFAERRFTELCLPYFQADQLVVLFCGNFGGALEFAGQLTSSGATTLPLIAETEGLVYACFKQDPTTVKVGGYKAGLACAALPARKTAEALERLQPLYPDFIPAASVLETGLRNLNPVAHAPVSILNAGRATPDRPKWRYYWEGTTEPVGRVAEAVDQERVAVADAAGLTLPSTLEVLLSWYGHQGAKGQSLAEVMSTNPAYEIAWAPQTLDHRFLTEDIPFGLVPIEAMGNSLGVATPVISALITLACQLLETDFRVEGRNLARLGLDGLSPEQVKQKVREGSGPTL